MVGSESTSAALVADAAARLGGSVGRIRLMGALALSLCRVAAGRLDACMSLKPTRSVDVAAGALVVRGAGGAVVLAEGGDLPLDLSPRSRIVAARDEATARRLLDLVG